MTEPTATAPDAYGRAKLRRRRARRFMQALTVLCALSAAGAGIEQLASGGLASFLDRPPGVGASPPQH